jgi:hypothetical protein
MTHRIKTDDVARAERFMCFCCLSRTLKEILMTTKKKQNYLINIICSERDTKQTIHMAICYSLDFDVSEEKKHCYNWSAALYTHKEHAIEILLQHCGDPRALRYLKGDRVFLFDASATKELNPLPGINDAYDCIDLCGHSKHMIRCFHPECRHGYNGDDKSNANLFIMPNDHEIIRLTAEQSASARKRSQGICAAVAAIAAWQPKKVKTVLDYFKR